MFFYICFQFIKDLLVLVFFCWYCWAQTWFSCNSTWLSWMASDNRLEFKWAVSFPFLDRMTRDIYQVVLMRHSGCSLAWWIFHLAQHQLLLAKKIDLYCMYSMAESLHHRNQRTGVHQDKLFWCTVSCKALWCKLRDIAWRIWYAHTASHTIFSAWRTNFKTIFCRISMIAADKTILNAWCTKLRTKTNTSMFTK